MKKGKKLENEWGREKKIWRGISNTQKKGKRKWPSRIRENKRERERGGGGRGVSNI